MRILPGVDSAGVHPGLWVALGVIGQLHKEATSAEMVVTSLRRPFIPGKVSKHAPEPGLLASAADIRRWALDAKGLSVGFCKDLQVRFGSWLGVVLEPDWLTQEEQAKFGTTGPHIHVQLRNLEIPPL